MVNINNFVELLLTSLLKLFIDDRFCIIKDGTRHKRNHESFLINLCWVKQEGKAFENAVHLSQLQTASLMEH